MININYFLIIMVIIIFFIILPTNEKLYFQIIKRKKGRKRNMPKELIKEFIGKVCSISLFNDSFGIVGKIEEVEDNWLKVTEKDGTRLINGDMIKDIKIMPDKYQKQ